MSENTEALQKVAVTMLLQAREILREGDLCQEGQRSDLWRLLNGVESLVKRIAARTEQEPRLVRNEVHRLADLRHNETLTAARRAEFRAIARNGSVDPHLDVCELSNAALGADLWEVGHLVEALVLDVWDTLSAEQISSLGEGVGLLEEAAGRLAASDL